METQHESACALSIDLTPQVDGSPARKNPISILQMAYASSNPSPLPCSSRPRSTVAYASQLALCLDTDDTPHLLYQVLKAATAPPEQGRL